MALTARPGLHCATCAIDGAHEARQARWEEDSPGEVSRGDRAIVTARLFRLTMVKPVEVVSVIEEPDRVGLAYRTLPRHPVSGEEA